MFLSVASQEFQGYSSSLAVDFLLEKLVAGHIRLLQVPDESPKEADRELSKVFG